MEVFLFSMRRMQFAVYTIKTLLQKIFTEWTQQFRYVVQTCSEIWDPRLSGIAELVIDDDTASEAVTP